jgi:hypothetical protein
MSLPIDRTAKSSLDTNLNNGITSDASALKASDDVVYNTIDELYNYTKSRLDGSTLTMTNVDAGLFTDSYTVGVDFYIDGGTFV